MLRIRFSAEVDSDKFIFLLDDECFVNDFNFLNSGDIFNFIYQWEYGIYGFGLYDVIIVCL